MFTNQIIELLGAPGEQFKSASKDIYFTYSPYEGRTKTLITDQLFMLKMEFDSDGKLKDWRFSGRPIYMTTPQGLLDMGP